MITRGKRIKVENMRDRERDTVYCCFKSSPLHQHNDLRGAAMFSSPPTYMWWSSFKSVTHSPTSRRKIWICDVLFFPLNWQWITDIHLFTLRYFCTLTTLFWVSRIKDRFFFLTMTQAVVTSCLSGLDSISYSAWVNIYKTFAAGSCH